MRRFMICAVIGATMLGALPASAQIAIQERAYIGVRHDRDDYGWRHRHHGWRHHYGWRHRYWRDGYAYCGVVRVRTRLPNGVIVIRTRRTC